ncbi:MAG: DUF3667 domain-containing protein [Longimicrobiales bacterium]|nr:DUF3667 domain-containing protein [Longimicrobiales bacterium]
MTEEPGAGRPESYADAAPEPDDPAADDATPRPPPLRPGRRGRGTRPVDPDRPCMNCGDPTPGEYCPSCGQRKVDVQVSVRTLLVDVMEDQFILDKRLPRTLEALFFHPGHMTVEHVNGRIVRYIHPFRLYLVTSLLFFLTLSFFSQQLVREATEDRGPSQRVAVVDDSLDAELSSLESAMARLERQAADTTLPEGLRSTLLTTRSQLEARRAELAARRDSLAPFVPDPSADTLAADTARAPAARAAQPTIAESLGWGDQPPTVDVPGPPVVDSAFASRIRRLGGMTPREAAQTLIETFFNYAPTLMFVLLPLFAGVLKLLYLRRGRYYAEHFVFLLHVHSFVFLLATVMLLAGGRVGGWLEAILGLWIVVYIYLAMKRVYGQGWLRTLAKYWTLGWMYFWILAFSIPVAFAVTLLLF